MDCVSSKFINCSKASTSLVVTTNVLSSATFNPCKYALSLFEYLFTVSPSSVSTVDLTKSDKSKSSLLYSQRNLDLDFVS